MEIHNFNYFNGQQVTDSRNAAKDVTNQDFDLDLQTVNHASPTNPEVQGSGHWWCHLTDKCTGAVCISIAVCR